MVQMGGWKLQYWHEHGYCYQQKDIILLGGGDKKILERLIKILAYTSL